MNKFLDLDQRVLQFFMRPTDKSGFYDFVVILFAQYLIYLIPIILLAYWFWPNLDSLRKTKERKNLLSAVLSGALAIFALNKIFISIFHRARPDLQLLHKQELFFHRSDFSFPSDHASLLFAITFYFYLSGEHKKGHTFLVLAIIVSIARISAGVHFPLDILGGVIVGLISAVIIKLLDRYLEVVWEKLIVLLKKIKLA